MSAVLRAAVTLVMMAAVAAMAAPTATASGGGATQTYIVVLQPGTSSVRTEASSIARQYSGHVGFIYGHALRGFSITASPAAAAGIARNPHVAYVEADQVVSTLDSQTTPTGIGRVFAARAGTPTSATSITPYNPNLGIDGVDDKRVDVDVAVIDTGIDLNNPDLNVVGSISCLNAASGSCVAGGDDDHYHGTHVAGTIAAIDNGFGVVGVAPGARLWAVKVLDSTGNGSTSGVIAGLDWVAARGGIEVANLSLGDSKSTALDTAVATAVGAGVSVVVAAGNSSADAGNYSPSGEPTAITVSALADFNGLPGGGAFFTCAFDSDDTFADFSNYGSVVDMIAPGLCIASTNNNSSTLRTISGTSMAAPHVAGAAALLRSMGKGVAVTESELKTSANLGWTGNPDSWQEPLLDVSNPAYFNPVMVATPANSAPNARFTSTCTNLACSFNGTGSSDPDGTIASYSWAFGDGSTGSGANPNHTYNSAGTYSVTLTVTDNLGATGSTAAPVTPTVPPTQLSFSGSASLQTSSWTAKVNVSGATPGSRVVGTWNVNGSSSSGSCTASTSGTCTFNRRKISLAVASVTWTYSADTTRVVTVSQR